MKWRFLLTDTGKVIRLICKQSVVRERRKLRRMARLAKAGKIPIKSLTESFSTWKANAQRGNCRKIILNMESLYNQLISEVRQNESQK